MVSMVEGKIMVSVVEGKIMVSMVKGKIMVSMVQGDNSTAGEAVMKVSTSMEAVKVKK